MDLKEYRYVDVRGMHEQAIEFRAAAVNYNNALAELRRAQGRLSQAKVVFESKLKNFVEARKDLLDYGPKEQ